MADRASSLSGRRSVGVAAFVMGSVAVVGTLVAAVLGWRLIGSPVERLDRLAVATSDALVALGENLDITETMITEIQAGVSTTGDLLEASTERLQEGSAGLSATAESIQGPIADQLSTVEQSLSDLVSSTLTLESTLATLSFLGVEYQPEVPLSQALGALQESLTPLPGALRAEGEQLAALAGLTATMGDQAGALAATIDDIAGGLSEAEARLSEGAESANEIHARLEAERAQLPLLGRRARVVLVIFATALVVTQLALVLVGWHWRRAS
ncbi:MAG TPA: hypothetical protein VK088_09000 [Acidimicrobiia bacterium]|nr:hypothetical protein [Acidimicrobiia bacterium]